MNFEMIRFMKLIFKRDIRTMNRFLMSLTNGRGSWVVGRGYKSWVVGVGVCVSNITN